MRRIALFGLLALALLSGCDSQPAKGKPQAIADAPVAAAPAKAGATTFTFSQAGSAVEFTGAKVTGKHEVKVKEFSGTIQLVEGDPTKSAVQVELMMASLESEPSKFVTHLKSPDLLDVEKFPKATFESTSIAPGTGNATHTVTGNLTLHGQTKSISFPATIAVRADGVSVNAEFGIKRQDFGVTYPGMPDDLIKDDVLVVLKLDAKKP
jgi:polyisoprenoid-binding protein YceI